MYNIQHGRYVRLRTLTYTRHAASAQRLSASRATSISSMTAKDLHLSCLSLCKYFCLCEHHCHIPSPCFLFSHDGMPLLVASSTSNLNLDASDRFSSTPASPSRNIDAIAIASISTALSNAGLDIRWKVWTFRLCGWLEMGQGGTGAEPRGSIWSLWPGSPLRFTPPWHGRTISWGRRVHRIHCREEGWKGIMPKTVGKIEVGGRQHPRFGEFFYFSFVFDTTQRAAGSPFQSSIFSFPPFSFFGLLVSFL